MGFKKFINGIFEPADIEDEEDSELTAEETVKAAPEIKAEPAQRRAPAAPAAAPAASASGNALELKICKPQSFAEVGSIADHLLNRCTVVLNLETTTKETARRIVDFLNGVAYSIDGQIKPVANNTFVLTPRSVSVSGEETEEAAVDDEKPDDSSFDNF